MKIYALQAVVWSIEGSLTGSVINALGKPKLGTMVLVGSLFLIPVCSYLGAQSGIVGVSWAFVIFAIVVVAVDQFILWRQFNFHVGNLFLAITRQAVAMLPMLGVGYLILCLGFLPYGTPPAILSFNWFCLAGRLIVYGIFCLFVYGLTVRFVLREDFLYAWEGIADALRRKK
jgi:hypothetical protein